MMTSITLGQDLIKELIKTQVDQSLAEILNAEKLQVMVNIAVASMLTPGVNEQLQGVLPNQNEICIKKHFLNNKLFVVLFFFQLNEKGILV